MQGNPDSGIREIPHAAAFLLLGIQAFLSTCNQALIRIKMAVQRKFVDKGLLKNVIRHTDASNKVGVYFCHIFIEFRFVLNIVLRKLLNHLARAQKKTAGFGASFPTVSQSDNQTQVCVRRLLSMG